MPTEKRKTSKVCIITTVDSSLYVLFPDFFPLLQDKGWEIVGICSDGPWLERVKSQGIRVIVVPMTRGFDVLSDVRCLWKLWRIFKVEQFDLVHYNTPKAALLAVLAGKAAGVPAMLYTLRGLGYTGFKGWRRLIGKVCEKIACGCADYVIAISNSLKTEAVKEHLLPGHRINVLGAGSSKGVDLKRFQKNSETVASAKRIRKDLGIGSSDVVIGYIGRPIEEKGINELVAAFCDLKIRYPRLHLLMVGHKDQRNPLARRSEEFLRNCEGVQILSFKDNVHEYVAAMDILVLPSYREGFGNSLIEASAMEIPVVATDISGCRDAVLDGKTGLLVKPRDAAALREALAALISNPGRRLEMGQNGRTWVEENFDRKDVWDRVVLVYEHILSNRSS